MIANDFGGSEAFVCAIVAIAGTAAAGLIDSEVVLVGTAGLPKENVLLANPGFTDCPVVTIVSGTVAADDFSATVVGSFGTIELVDCDVVTGVVMALTVDTITLVCDGGAMVDTTVCGNWDSVTLVWLDKPSEMPGAETFTAEATVVSLTPSRPFTVGLGATASTWSSSSSRSPLRQLNISANFDDSTVRLVNFTLSTSLDFGLTNEILAVSSSSSSEAHLSGWFLMLDCFFTGV